MGSAGWGFGAAFLGSAVESVEALTIVLAVGVTRGWRAPLPGVGAALIVLAVGVLGVAGLGGLAAVVCVAVLGVVLRRPLTRVPENTVKHAVGVLLASLGTFWAGEGFGVHWPLDAVSVLALVALYLGADRLSIALLRAPARSVPASKAA